MKILNVFPVSARPVGAICLLLVSVGTVIAEDLPWNQFRGPRGDGTSLAKNLPVTFAENSPEVVWKTAIPGRAWASPVLCGSRIWLSNCPELRQPAKGKEKLDTPLKMSVLSVDLQSGAIEHQIDLFDVYKPQITHDTNTYASSTPCVDEGRLYAHFGAYGTACLDGETGEVIWKRDDLPCDHFRGPGSSPVVYEPVFKLQFCVSRVFWPLSSSCGCKSGIRWFPGGVRSLC